MNQGTGFFAALRPVIKNFLSAALLISFFTLPAGAAVQLKGVVVDNQKVPVTGVRVSLVINGLSDTTDATGTFILNSTGILPRIYTGSGAANSLRILKDRLVLIAPASEKASLGIYTVNGVQIACASGKGTGGSISLATNKLSRGFYLAKVVIGNNSTVVRFPIAGNASFMKIFSGNGSGTAPRFSAKIADSALDTLVFQRTGYERKGIPLASLTDTSLSIIMDSTGPVRSIQSTSTGGLWFSKATWIGGIVPGAMDNVVIAGEVQVNVSGTDSAECRTITIEKTGVLRAEAYSARILKVYGSLINRGDVRNGPNYASYDNASFYVRLRGGLVQDSLYRPSNTWFTGDSAQTLSVGPNGYLSGSFVDKNPVSPLLAGSDLGFRSFSLAFDSSSAAGLLDMGDRTFMLKSGAFSITRGTLRTNILFADSLTDFTCPRIRSASGPTHLRGSVRTANAQFDSSVVVDSGAIFFNQSYTDAVVTVKGSFTNRGLTRRGPGYSAYGEGNLALWVEKDFTQAGIYTVQLTRFTGASSRTLTVDTGSVLQGSYYSDVAAGSITAGSAIKFRDFSLDFGTTAGRLVMGTFQPRIRSGAFLIKAGTLITASIQGDSNTTFTCPKITGAAGVVTLKGMICTDSAMFEGDVIVDNGAVFYNKSYTDAVVTVKGSFINNGLTRRGPGYAAYGEGNLALLIEKNFRQNGTYTVQLTRFTGSAVQTIGTDSGKVIQGLFYDDTPLSGLRVTTPLVVNDAKFVMSPDTVNKGTIVMDTFRLTHPTGNFQIDSGSLQVDSITGGVDGYTVFTIRKITVKNGSLTVNRHYRTSSVDIAGTLVVDTDGRFYNQAYISAYVTATATTVRGKIGSGPGYAAYGEGLLFINGTQMAVWR